MTSKDLRSLVDDYIEAYRKPAGGAQERATIPPAHVEGSLRTPVALFAEAHESQSAAYMATARAQLIPLSAPHPGEQYAFEVNLDACTGCKACVAACHSLNGLDETEAWRDVGLIVGSEASAPYQQTITSACHHCADPGCMNGCPVLAYEKDPVTGIVRHLDDQCIGCQYCILKCPYDVPKYNPRLGIVRKCDMCHQRLEVGEAPACAQACPTHAIRIVKVPVTLHAHGRPEADTAHFLAAAPDASLTLPTTRFVSKRPIPSAALAADAGTPRVQPAHLPLVAMLTLTQAGYGLLLGARLAPADEAPTWTEHAGLCLIAFGLAASALHLGQPLRMWRVFLNLRRSWLSREAVILGLSSALLFTGAALDFLPVHPQAESLALQLKDAGLITGLLGVLCSAMLYIDTGRSSWSALPVSARMGGTVLAYTALCFAQPLAAMVLALKLGAELSSLLHAKDDLSRDTASARLLRGPLLAQLAARHVLGGVAVLACLASLPAWVCAALILAGELLERTLFFRAVTPSAMPSVPGGTDSPHAH